MKGKRHHMDYQRLSFPKRNRLLKADEYQRVFKQGRKYRGAWFLFICCPNELSHARLGLAIAKRHIASAVVRNRIRRLIRESFRHYQTKLGAIDIIVMMQKELLTVNNEVCKDLHHQWQALFAARKVPC